MATSIDIVIARILNVILAIIVFFLGLRIIFELFAANSAAPFVTWVYDISSVLLAPFRGIFPSQEVGKAYFDLPAFIALIIYALIVQLGVYLVSSFVRPRETVYTDHEHVV